MDHTVYVPGYDCHNLCSHYWYIWQTIDTCWYLPPGGNSVLLQILVTFPLHTDRRWLWHMLILQQSLFVYQIATLSFLRLVYNCVCVRVCACARVFGQSVSFTYLGQAHGLWELHHNGQANIWQAYRTTNICPRNQSRQQFDVYSLGFMYGRSNSKKSPSWYAGYVSEPSLNIHVDRVWKSCA